MYTLSLGRTETVFLLEKHPQNQSREQSSGSKYERFYRSIGDYITQTSRSFYNDGVFYSATILQFKSPSKPVLSQDKLTALLQGDQENAPKELGKPYPGRKDDLLITYAVICLETLSSTDHLGKYPEWFLRPSYGMCVLKCDGRLFQFEPITLPMRAYLCGPDIIPPPSHQVCETSNGNYHLRLCMKFINPQKYSQSKDNIIVPKMRCSEFLLIQLEGQKHPSRVNAPIFTVTEVTVLLLELTSYEGLPKANITEKVFRTRVLQRSRPGTCFKWELEFFHSDPPIYVFPFCAYDCGIPNISPTYFSNALQRSYALSCSVKVTVEGVTTRLTTFLEINVAEKPSMSKRITKFLDENVFGEPFMGNSVTEGNGMTPKNMYQVLRFKKNPRDQLSLQINCDENYWEAKHHGSHFLSQITTTFSRGTDIYAVTKIQAHIPKLIQIKSEEDLMKDLEAWGLNEIGDVPLCTDRLDLLFCEVQKVEAESCQHPNNTNLSRLILFWPASATSTCLYLRRPRFTDDWLEIERVYHDRYSDLQGSNIVYPGMMLSDFLVLRLVSQFNNDYFAANLRHFSRTEITLWETLRSDPLRNQATVNRSKLLLEKLTHDVSVKSYRHWSGGRYVSIPAHLYDCKIPQLGPSFVSKHISRSYRIEVKLRLGDSQLTEVISISIASEPKE